MTEGPAAGVGEQPGGELDRTGDELIDLTFAALDHAVESVSAGQGPLIPFVMAVRPGAGDDQRELLRYVAETLEDGIDAAREHLRTTAYERCALAWDGYLTVSGERTDAVFVEAQEHGRPVGICLAQRYSRTEGQFELIGAPASIGDIPPLLG
jgi:hypothetical protein